MSGLSGGLFVPNIGIFGLLAPGLASLAPAETPVMMSVSPNFPMLVDFGTGEGEGDDRDSHLNLFWPNLELELYPLLDDVYQRVLSFSMDVVIGLTLEPTPNGSIQLMFDRIALENTFETYNEIGTAFDPTAIGNLVGAFLPLLLEGGEPIELALTSEALGLPFVPKLSD